MKNISKSTTIAVIYGGRSKERPGSLISGEAVYKSLLRQGFSKAYLVDSIDGDFFVKVDQADVVFLLVHGRYGEDGKIQGYLETIGKPYVGSGVLASALGMDKYYFKSLLKLASVPTPDFELILGELKDSDANLIVKNLGLPLFLKPISEGGSLGSNVIHSKKQLLRDLRNFREQRFDKFLVEKYISGRSLTTGVLGRRDRLLALPILETVSKKEFYDYEAKHNSDLHEYICPADLNHKITDKLQNLALKVYNLVGCYGFCRVDFILETKTINPYVLEVNTLPGMSTHSNMVISAKAEGISYDDLVKEMLNSAFDRPEYLP